MFTVKIDFPECPMYVNEQGRFQLELDEKVRKFNSITEAFSIAHEKAGKYGYVIEPFQE